MDRNEDGAGDQVLAEVTSTATRGFAYDASQNVTHEIFGGAITATSRYEAFGGARATNGSVTSLRGFASAMRENATGLIAMGARHYDPATGTFLQTDPLYLTTNQLYAYASNNPYAYWDPSGLSSQSYGMSSGGNARSLSYSSPALSPSYTSSGSYSSSGSSRPVSYTNSSSIVDLASASLLQTAESVTCTTTTKILETGWGLGFLGDIGTASTLGIAGALSSGGAGAAFVGLEGAGGFAAAGALATGATVTAAAVAATTGAYLSAFAATTYVNAVNTAFGTDFASFSNMPEPSFWPDAVPYSTIFPDLTKGPGLQDLWNAAGGSGVVGGCR